MLISCGPKKTTIINNIVEDTQPKLIFLNYSVSKDDNGNTQIHFIDKTITDGKLKNRGDNYVEAPSKGDLKCSQLDENAVELISVIVQNPLVKTMEYVNDSLTFEKRTIALNRAILSLRLQLYDKTKYISISEITDKLLTKKPLITTKLD